jgi:hypothetical protein
MRSPGRLNQPESTRKGFGEFGVVWPETSGTGPFRDRRRTAAALAVAALVALTGGPASATSAPAPPTPSSEPTSAPTSAPTTRPEPTSAPTSFPPSPAPARASGTPAGVADDAAVLRGATSSGPLAVDDDAVTDPGTQVSIDVAANDDASGYCRTVDDPPNGTAVDLADGSVGYTPDPGFAGEETFTYAYRTSCPDGPDVARATVTVHVADPAAVDDTAGVMPGRAVTVRVLDNDRHAAGFGIRVTDPGRGDAEVDGDVVRYTPDDGVVDGTDTFDYDLVSTEYVGSLGRAVARARVTVAITAPRLGDDVAYTTAGTEVLVDLDDNDTLPDGSDLAIVRGPGLGEADLDCTCRTASYRPGPGFAAADLDTFEYAAVEEKGYDTRELARATVTVFRVDAVDDRAVATHRRARDVDVRANDHGAAALGVALTTAPPAGTVDVTRSGGVFHVRPLDGFAGTATFAYALLDPGDGTRVVDTATVTVEVPMPAVAYPDEATTPPGVPVTVEVLRNDARTAGLHPVLRRPATRGTATVVGDDVRYLPATGLAGDDTFRYGLATRDGAVLSEAEVTVRVTPPTAGDDAADAFAGHPVGIDVRANDTHAEDFTVRVAPPVAGAVVQFDGSVVYTPPAGVTGERSFRYELVDAHGDAVDDATVVVTATAVRARDDAGRTSASAPVTIDVLGNDAGGAGLAVRLDVAPRHGAATVNADGSLTYTPGSGFGSTDRLRYALTGLVQGVRTDLATADVVVTRVDPVDDAAETAAGDAVTVSVLANDVNAAGLAPRIVDAPDDGTVTVAGDGVGYTPRAGFAGRDTFRYTLAGDGRTFGAATVTITVREGEPVPARRPDRTTSSETTSGPDPEQDPDPSRDPSPVPITERSVGPNPGPRRTTPPRLTVDVRSASPGAGVTVRGTGCPPRGDAEIAIDGHVARSVETSRSGTFRARITAPARIGRHAVSVTCGRATQAAELDVVVTTLQSATQAPAGAAAIAGGLLMFFLLSGLGLNPTGRRGYANRR